MLIWWRHQKETFPALLVFFCGEFTGQRWIPCTKASDAELWYFLWSAPEPTGEQIMETSTIWDAIALILMSLKWKNGLPRSIRLVAWICKEVIKMHKNKGPEQIYHLYCDWFFNVEFLDGLICLLEVHNYHCLPWDNKIWIANLPYRFGIRVNDCHVDFCFYRYFPTGIVIPVVAVARAHARLMLTSSNVNIFRVTGPLWYFLWC